MIPVHCALRWPGSTFQSRDVTLVTQAGFGSEETAGHERTRSTKFKKLVAGLGAGVLACGTLAACGGSDDGVPVINLYGGTSAAGFDKLIDACNKEAAGEYKIVGNLLPSDADGQREQFVRRLAAKDDGMDLLGMDVTWTAEFAEAGWIRELTDEQKDGGDQGHPPAAPSTRRCGRTSSTASPSTPTSSCSGTASPWCPRPPKTWDEVLAMAKKLKDDGKPYVIGITAAQYEGYVVGFNTILASLGGNLVNEDSTKVDDRRQDRGGPGDPPGPGDRADWRASRSPTARSPRSSLSCRTTKPRSS